MTSILIELSPSENSTEVYPFSFIGEITSKRMPSRFKKALLVVEIKKTFLLYSTSIKWNSCLFLSFFIFSIIFTFYPTSSINGSGIMSLFSSITIIAPLKAVLTSYKAWVSVSPSPITNGKSLYLAKYPLPSSLVSGLTIIL